MESVVWAKYKYLVAYTMELFMMIINEINTGILTSELRRFFTYGTYTYSIWNAYLGTYVIICIPFLPQRFW